MIPPLEWKRAANYISLLRIILSIVAYPLLFFGSLTSFLIVVIVAALSDFFDGLVARRWDGATEWGARIDSWADYVFYFSMPVWLLLRFPTLLHSHGWWFLGLGILFFVSAVLQLLRYGRFLHRHSIFNKAGAGVSFVVFFLLFILGENTALIRFGILFASFVVLTDLWWIAGNNR